ncbi:hypothetical protein C7999DRAFT_17892 [Corynascus novoguineensis]|uniref:non-specific serine/threonine protein kinase n=1 Tax=Corynascus novoguineensis TaxID=1126955 RepID=A0AAN7HIZ4_9PEZI|nr:hypothetical protein C7999DRAFT_17892 [Corynascus novoguineensis]
MAPIESEDKPAVSPSAQENSIDVEPGVAPTNPSQRILMSDPGDIEEGEDAFRPGGFHPVYIGDLFKNARHKVLNKIGYGAYSTVWLARDLTKP